MIAIGTLCIVQVVTVTAHGPHLTDVGVVRECEIERPDGKRYWADFDQLRPLPPNADDMRARIDTEVTA